MTGLVAALGAVALCASAFAQSPPAAEQAAFIEKARGVALRYSDMLPDFVCSEVVHRAWGDYTDTRNHDAVTFQLTYFQKRENYKPVESGKPADAPRRPLGGASSAGEFGSALRWIFEPDSAAEFHWEKLISTHGERFWVYSYRVPRARSRYVLSYGSTGDMIEELVAFHGILQIAGQTGATMRLTYEADDIPAGLPIRRAFSSVDYGYAEVGGGRYLLPSHASTRMYYVPNRSVEKRPGALHPMTFENDADFRAFRKFEVNSAIDFGGPNP